MLAFFPCWCFLGLIGQTSAWLSTSNSEHGTLEGKWNNAIAQKDSVADDIKDRRLSTPMSREEILEMLQNYAVQNQTFTGVTYLGRTIDFKLLLDGTRWIWIAPFLERVTAIASPFSHHALIFPLNGTLASHLEEQLHLVIHLQRPGVQGRLIMSSPAADLPSYSFVGSIPPSWVLKAFSAIEEREFSSTSWNCHHFAVRLFTNLARTCATSGVLQCPPEKLDAAFPWAISPSWCNFGQKFGIMLSAAVPSMVSVFLGHQLLKLLKRNDEKKLGSSEA